MDRATVIAVTKDRIGTIGADVSDLSYSFAVDAALRELGALDTDDLPDITELDETAFNQIVGVVEREILERLYNEYTLKVDVAVGQRRESLSQIAAGIAKRLSGKSGGSGVITTGNLTHWSDDDYDADNS